MADLAIVKAWRADTAGNLVFRKTARNFNVPAGMSGRVTVAEVEEIVPAGAIDPDHVHLPAICGAPYDKQIEFRTTRERMTA